MKKITILYFILLAAVQLNAYEKRDLLQHAADLAKIKEALVMEQKWVPYPDYTDRNGWNQFLGEYKEGIIRQGEKYLNFDWKVVRATDYMEYERSGNRRIMEDPLGANNTAIGALVLAEMAEGKGRFIDEIINGVLQACEMTSWSLSAHLASAQHTHRAFPDFREDIMDLVSGNMSQMLSWTYHFLHKEFDKTDPAISLRLRHELQKRELDPYMQRSDFWWMAFDYKPGTLVNNWNPWCNFNALNCFLLLENDRDKLAKAVLRTMISTDKFLNYVKADGACEEGPSYWGHAAGKLYDYLQILSLGTGGKISIFNQPQIRYMGEYIVRSYIGNGWVVNFADASARGGGDVALIYRYGVAVNSNMMKGYDAEKNQEKPVKPATNWLDMFRGLETLRFMPQLKEEKATYRVPAYTWYPETEFCYLSNKNGFFVAAKGGYNNESHNHNDAGTFSLYLNTTPILIDAGVGTYTRQTFSNERYSIWTMQSNYHNLPVINGVPQKFGSEYKATDVKANSGQQTFSANIATAYPVEAGVEKWIRAYYLEKNKLKIEDKFTLKETTAPNQINFLTWGKVDISQPGTVIIKVNDEKVCLDYDKNMFDATIETIQLKDTRLSNVWGPEIYRVSLQAQRMQYSGTYVYNITKLKN